VFNVSSWLLDDALEQATPLINGAINETLRQFAPLSDNCSLELGTVQPRGWSTSYYQLITIIGRINSQP